MGLKQYLSGILGEDAACAYLKKQGFEIIERNFHSKFGEIDIVAKRGEILHFIEVKSTAGNYEVAYRVDKAKFEKLLKAVDFYLLKNGLEADFQMDLLCIYKDKMDFRENITF